MQTHRLRRPRQRRSRPTTSGCARMTVICLTTLSVSSRTAWGGVGNAVVGHPPLRTAGLSLSLVKHSATIAAMVGTRAPHGLHRLPGRETHAEAHDRPRPRSMGRRVELERRRHRTAEPGLHRPRPAEPAARGGDRRCRTSPRSWPSAPAVPSSWSATPTAASSSPTPRPVAATSRLWCTSTRSFPTKARRSSRSSAGPARRSTSPTRPPSWTSPATRATGGRRRGVPQARHGAQFVRPGPAGGGPPG